MSRTIRRKNSSLRRPFYVDSYYNVCENFWPWSDNDYSEKHYQKDQRFYHSDKWVANAPKAFRQTLNGSLRCKNKAILGRAIRDLNDEPVFRPFIKDANWMYW